MRDVGGRSIQTGAPRAPPCVVCAPDRIDGLILFPQIRDTGRYGFKLWLEDAPPPSPGAGGADHPGAGAAFTASGGALLSRVGHGSFECVATDESSNEIARSPFDNTSPADDEYDDDEDDEYDDDEYDDADCDRGNDYDRAATTWAARRAARDDARRRRRACRVATAALRSLPLPGTRRRDDRPCTRGDAHANGRCSVDAVGGNEAAPRLSDDDDDEDDARPIDFLYGLQRSGTNFAAAMFAEARPALRCGSSPPPYARAHPCFDLWIGSLFLWMC